MNESTFGENAFVTDSIHFNGLRTYLTLSVKCDRGKAHQHITSARHKRYSPDHAATQARISLANLNTAAYSLQGAMQIALHSLLKDKGSVGFGKRARGRGRKVLFDSGHKLDTKLWANRTFQASLATVFTGSAYVRNNVTLNQNTFSQDRVASIACLGHVIVTVIPIMQETKNSSTTNPSISKSGVRDI